MKLLFNVLVFFAAVIVGLALLFAFLLLLTSRARAQELQPQAIDVRPNRADNSLTVSADNPDNDALTAQLDADEIERLRASRKQVAM